MKQRRVRFTSTARSHVWREKLWWLENRTHTEIFAAEFEEALRILAVLPGAGTYTDPGVGYYEAKYRERILRSLSKRATSLGFQLVQLQPVSDGVS